MKLAEKILSMYKEKEEALSVKSKQQFLDMVNVNKEDPRSIAKALNMLDAVHPSNGREHTELNKAKAALKLLLQAAANN
jgi:hypothetical protein